VQIIQEPILSRECSDSDNAFQEFTEVRENRRSRVGFHASKITSSVQVANGEFIIPKTNEKCRDEETRENDPGNNWSRVQIEKQKRTDATVRIAAKKLARDELTAWREPAKEESIVSIS